MKRIIYVFKNDKTGETKEIMAPNEMSAKARVACSGFVYTSWTIIRK